MRNRPPFIEDEDDEEIDRPLRPRRHRRRFEEDDEDRAFEEEESPQDELVEILDSIERQRERLNCYHIRLTHLLRRNPELQDQYQRFSQASGLTAKDFELFLKGELRPRITRTKKHLRLVSNRKPLTNRLRLRDRNRNSNDDDAA